ncbi:MAG: hypothetical protein JSW02_02060 [candidate division WOR-3 bacterium]|nr:MAG: hypothetical protein JSW02_02060 [candidate division WOR-3 bacterium]
MKKISIVMLALVISLSAQCLGSPINTRAGIKFGVNPGTLEEGDGGDVFSGTGMHFGIGQGTDILNLLSLDMLVMYRATTYSRVEALDITHSYSYKNLYFPIVLSLKAGMLPLISPYISAGIGFNIQLSGIERFEGNGLAIENDIAGLGTHAYAILGLGVEVKLIKLRIVPEFTANINGSLDDDATEDIREGNVDYHISVGVYYAP